MSHDTDLVLCHNLGRLQLLNMTRITNIATTRGNSPCQLITTLSHMRAISSNNPVVIVVVIADMLLMANHPIDLVLYPLRFKQVDIIRRLTLTRIPRDCFETKGVEYEVNEIGRAHV